MRLTRYSIVTCENATQNANNTTIHPQNSLNRDYVFLTIIQNSNIMYVSIDITYPVIFYVSKKIETAIYSSSLFFIKDQQFLNGIILLEIPLIILKLILLNLYCHSISIVLNS